MAVDASGNRLAVHTGLAGLAEFGVAFVDIGTGPLCTLKNEPDHFWRAEAGIGFMERPDVPGILSDRPRRRGLPPRRRDGRIGGGPRGGASLAEALLAATNRNAGRMNDRRCDREVETGGEIET